MNTHRLSLSQARFGFTPVLLGIWSLLSGCLLWTGCGRSGVDAGSEGETMSITLLNVSYDPTREFYQALNPEFVQYWKQKTGQTATIRMSHGGAGKQARSVIDGLEADVVTLALEYDINAIAATGLMDPQWRSRLPHDSAPYTSLIVFLVRKGNPKQISDWPDLVKPGVQVITPNPKTSGGARWNILAAWAFAMQTWKSEEKARQYLSDLFQNVPVLDTGARGSTITFVERNIGDVFLSWENEALMALAELGQDRFDIVYPSVSILAEPPVTVVDRNCHKHNTCDAATAYLEFLYSERGQELAATHHFRPRSDVVIARYRDRFPDISLVTLDAIAGDWNSAQKRFFDDNGIFDQVFAATKKRR